MFKKCGEPTDSVPWMHSGPLPMPLALMFASLHLTMQQAKGKEVHGKLLLVRL